MSHEFYNLRGANKARQAEWDKDNQISLGYRGNEAAGEIGEALDAAIDVILLGIAGGRASNIIKKLERQRMGIAGSRASVSDLADELADVVICADLIAMNAGIDLEEAVAAKFNKTSEKVGLRTRLINRVEQTPGETAQDHCEACAEPLEKGDMVYWTYDGGYICAACTGTDPEGFLDSDGEPLRPGDPIPEPFAYGDDGGKA